VLAVRVTAIRAVSAHEAETVAPLTWKSFRGVLAAADPALRAVCLAAWSGDTPVALAVSAASPEHRPEEGQQRLLSLMVASGWRRQGVARRLLAELEETLASSGGLELSTQFSDQLPGAAAFTGLLAAAGWTAPIALRYRICGAVQDTFVLFRDRERLLRRLADGGFRIQSWRDRAEAALSLAEAAIAAGTAPGWSHPGRWQQSLDPDLSLVVTTADGQAAGWVVCEYQPALSRLYYPIGWLVPPYDRQGWLLGAYAVGAERAVAKYGGATPAVIETGAAQQGMWRLFERHFQPHAHWTDRLVESCRRTAQTKEVGEGDAGRR